jgi:hypothetical protein
MEDVHMAEKSKAGIAATIQIDQGSLRQSFVAFNVKHAYVRRPPT